MPTSSSDSSSLYSPQLAEAVGYVCLEASQVEDSLGELLILRRHLPESDPDWWKTGAQLVSALRSVGDPELDPIITGYERLAEQRNDVIHATWMEFGGHTIGMRRIKTRKNAIEPNSYRVSAQLSVSSLEVLARDFRALGAMIDDAISDAMGLSRGDASGLPQRTVPLTSLRGRNPR